MKDVETGNQVKFGYVVFAEKGIAQKVNSDLSKVYLPELYIFWIWSYGFGFQEIQKLFDQH